MDFDPETKLVTSYLFTPRVLAYIRLSFALFTSAVLIFSIVWSIIVLKDGQQFFAYFTNLTFTGMSLYFWASGFQTWQYSRQSKGEFRGTYPLQRWPWLFQYLHKLLHTTIVTFPFIVTAAFWILIAPTQPPFSNWFTGFSNITKHAMNSGFALFELLLANVGPHPWLHLLWTVLILGLYTAFAYIIVATQHFYPYTFLNPAEKGSKGVAMAVGGIIVSQIVLFLITQGIIALREILARRRGERSRPTASLASLGAEFSLASLPSSSYKYGVSDGSGNFYFSDSREGVAKQ